MSYTSVVNEVRERELDKRASDFVNNPAFDIDLPTVVLLPGGMGSGLFRSRVAYSEPYTNTEFYNVWLDIDLAVGGELRELAMTVAGADIGTHPIIASGELSSIVKAYDGIAGSLAGRANFIGLGYDWRRPLDEEHLYVRSFLRRFAAKVRAKWPTAPDPRSRLTLFAHSQGGLVAKLFVNDLVERGEPVTDWFERLVTCCTPFYGTWSHLSRFYTGVSLANVVTGGAVAVSGIVASLRGPYILLPAPRPVLEPRYARLGLARYPVRDFVDAQIACDAFDPAMRARLPDYIVDQYLDSAHQLYSRIDRPLPDAVAARVYHIRSNGNSGDRPFELRWQAVAPGAEPAAHNGAEGGMHDDTVPFWAARLATTPDENVFDVLGVPHGGAAENPTVLATLLKIMDGNPPAPGPQPTTPGPAYGSTEAMRQLLIDVRDGVLPVSALKAQADPELRALERGLTIG